MKLKKDIYHFIFFDIFFEMCILFLVGLGFFLGCEHTLYNFHIFICVNAIIISLGIIVYVLYILICKSYYEFDSQSLKIIKNNKTIKEIKYTQIKSCAYYKFYHLLFGDPKGGKLVINFTSIEEQTIEISFTKKLLKKLNIHNIHVV